MNNEPVWDVDSDLRARVEQERHKYRKSIIPPAILVVAGKRHIAADQGLYALVKAKVPFYERDRKIVHVAPAKAKNSNGETFEVPTIMPVTPAILDRALGQSATWKRVDVRSREMSAIDPPKPVVQQIIDMVGEWPFPPLRGIIQCPTLRRDGSLLASNGYDEVTGLVLFNSLEFPAIAYAPSENDALRALSLLTALLTEFPFVDEASRAVALSMILTVVLRAAMEVAPMHLATAPLPGTGKSFLADVAAMIATGERCPVKSASKNPEETEKRLIGSALGGRPIIALDNCRDVLEGDFLCQVTERPLLELRPLGTSKQSIVANNFTVFANGNNVAIAEDMVRRTIRCGMDANCESPEKRTFKLNPLAMIRADRGKYVAACLTIARAYVAAGRPNPLTPLPSFEEWSGMVREPLIWLGCSDPVDTMEALRDEDPKSAERCRVFDAWKSTIGVGKYRTCLTSGIIEKAGQNGVLCEALLAVARQRVGDAIDPTALGKWLSRQEKNIASGCKLMSDRTDKNRPKWYLELQGSGGSVG
jgi:putative DNA primase/helicase